jgi:hypothetical protein
MIVKESRRSCFYFGENINLRLAVYNWTPINQKNCTLSFYLDRHLVESRSLPVLGTHTDSIVWQYDSSLLCLGEHTLRVALRNDDGINWKSSFKLWVAEQPNRETMASWHWPSTVHYDALEASRKTALIELDKLRDCGFTWANFRDEWALLHPDEAVFLIEEAMKRGIELGILVENAKGGIFRRGDAPDADCIMAQDGTIKNMLNPHKQGFKEKVVFHIQCLMTLFAEFPSVRTLFVNSELEDMLALSCDPETRTMHERKMGFSLDELRNTFRTDAFAYLDAPFIRQGVVADDDKEVAYMKYYFTEGDGWSATNRLMAEVAHRYRPDMIVLTDPYRLCPIPQRFAGMDAVSSWTYTNPDPKTSLFVETLDCASRHLGNASIPSITLWNYAGSIFPSGENRKNRELTVRMGPDRWTECAWFYLSRGGMALGSYFGSPMEIFIDGGNEYVYSRATEAAMASFCKNVLVPFGELARNTRNIPRNVAVLDCLTARVYGNPEREHTHYANYQIYNFATLLAMSHIPFDVIIEDDVLAGELKHYDMLVLARADVMTESIYRKICAYAKQGGIVIKDQQCLADIPRALTFSFDFFFRKGVNANALSTSQDYASKDDQSTVDIVKKKTMPGVTADQDRAVMEKYAAALREKLDAILPRKLDCSTPRLILNPRCSKNTTYIFVVNDNRTYDERTAIWKSIEEKGLPQAGTISIELPYKQPQFRELLSGKALKVRQNGNMWSVDVKVPAAGGAIIAAFEKGSLPRPVATTTVRDSCLIIGLENCGTDLRPFQIEYNQKRHVKYTRDNVYSFVFPLENKEEAPLQITITDLLTGSVCTA